MSDKVFVDTNILVTYRDATFPAKQAWDDVRLYAAWEPSPVEFETLIRARETQQRYGISWWDALIVASAHVQECRQIYSGDLATGQLYWGILVVNPLLPSPTETPPSPP